MNTLKLLRLVVQLTAALTLMFVGYGIFFFTTSDTTGQRPMHVKSLVDSSQRPKHKDRRSDKSPTTQHGGSTLHESVRPAVKKESVNHDRTDTGSSSKEKSAGKQKYLIYLCDKKQSCGGLGDRERGIVATYLLAQVTGRQFGINMTYPCDVKYFLVPNKINWIISKSDIKGLSTRYVEWLDTEAVEENIGKEFNDMYPEDVIFLRTKLDLTGAILRSTLYSPRIPQIYKGKRVSYVFGQVWNQLMAFTISFSDHLDMISSKIPENGNLICAHVRMRYNPTTQIRGKGTKSIQTLKKIWKFLSEYKINASRIFIATDSTEVKESARAWFQNQELDSEGLITHVDSQGKFDQACLGLEMALVDQVLLKRCKVLVCSKSIFDQRASFMSGLKQEVYVFHNGTIRRTH